MASASASRRERGADMRIRQPCRAGAFALLGALGALGGVGGPGGGEGVAAAAGAGAGVPAADRLREQVRAYRLQHEKEIVHELATFSSLRNVARDRADMAANADALVAMLKRRGIPARRLEAAGSPPAVYGELRAAGARRTLVVYAHYDGQPADPADWHGNPWQPVLRTGPLPAGKEVDLASAPEPLPSEWRLFARAASDDKGPIVGMLTALDALRSAGIPPSLNLKFFFEGEEEAGSPHLATILEQNRELLAADAWVRGDGPVRQGREFQSVFRARGYTGL